MMGPISTGAPPESTASLHISTAPASAQSSDPIAQQDTHTTHTISASLPAPSTSNFLPKTERVVTATSNPPKRKKDESKPRAGPLDKWCFSATAEVARCDREKLDRMHMEVMEERKEEDEANEARRKRRKIEGANERKRRERLRKKEAEIESGRRDSNGKVIAVKRAQTLPLALTVPPPATLNVAEASRPLREATEHKRQQQGTIG